MRKEKKLLYNFTKNIPERDVTFKLAFPVVLSMRKKILFSRELYPCSFMGRT